ncbi:MAG: hypothetical protein K5930_06500 [Treponemataceae bacterium]|nr:hypothetical protein [Treponemataceae bacterium]
MKRNSVMRYVYGLGLIIAAVGFALPIIDLGIFGGKFNGFQIADFLGKMPKICLYVLFGLFCLGGILAFVPKLKKIDLLVFLLIIIDVAAMVFSFTGGKSSGNSVLGDLFGDSIANLVLDLLQPGAWMLIIGFALALIAFILGFFVKGKK